MRTLGELTRSEEDERKSGRFGETRNVFQMPLFIEQIRLNIAKRGKVSLNFGFELKGYVNGSGQYVDRYCILDGNKFYTAVNALYDSESEALRDGGSDAAEDVTLRSDLRDLIFTARTRAEKSIPYTATLRQ